MSCRHRVCAKLKKGNACGSLSVVLVAPGPVPHVLLVKQNSGQYKGKYTICSGKRDACDGECWVATAIRELREEMKLSMSERQFLDICDHAGKTQVLRKGSTPIFIGVLRELSALNKSVNLLTIFRDSLNRAIEVDRTDAELPEEYKEVSRVDWFDFDMAIYIPNDEEAVVFSPYSKIVFPDLQRRFGKVLRVASKVSP